MAPGRAAAPAAPSAQHSPEALDGCSSPSLARKHGTPAAEPRALCQAPRSKCRQVFHSTPVLQFARISALDHYYHHRFSAQGAATPGSTHLVSVGCAPSLRLQRRPHTAPLRNKAFIGNSAPALTQGAAVVQAVAICFAVAGSNESA
jgi:hypothetical protein